MSDGRPVPSVAPVGANKPQRVIYRTLCEIHNVEYGREMVPSTPEHESYLVGNCPKCEEDVRISERWKQKVIQDEKEVHEEAVQFCATEEGCEARRREIADAYKNADRARRAEEFFDSEDKHFALQDANYLALAAKEDLQQIEAGISERRRIAYFEEQQGIKEQANAEWEKKLDDDREKRTQAALASWVTL